MILFFRPAPGYGLAYDIIGRWVQIFRVAVLYISSTFRGDAEEDYERAHVQACLGGYLGDADALLRSA